MQREGGEELERGELRKELARVLAGAPNRVEREHGSYCCEQTPGALRIIGVGRVEGHLDCLVLVCEKCGQRYGSRSAHYSYTHQEYSQLPRCTYWIDTGEIKDVEPF